MSPPASTAWRSLRPSQALALVALGLALELPLRGFVRPDMAHLLPGSPWFDLSRRLVVETVMILLFLASAPALGASLAAIGIPLRPWTRWEWRAFLIVAAGELAVVAALAGPRWGRIGNSDAVAAALPWVVAEFLFGFNQETGFRGLLMTGLLRTVGWKWAFTLNTLVFLLGPLHGQGLLADLSSHPGPAGAYATGVIVCGLAFSWLRYRTDNVVLCAVLHGLINGPLNGAGLFLRASP